MGFVILRYGRGATVHNVIGCAPCVRPSKGDQMAKMTAAMVKKLKPSIKRRFIRDDSTQSLYLVIQPSGVKTWQMRFRGPDGRPVKMVLGRLHAGGETPGTPTIGEPLTLHGARQLAAQVHREREQGLDPAAQHKARKHRARAEIKERKADTFGSAICEFFIEYRTKKWKQRLRRWRDDAAVLGLRYPVDCDPGTIEPEVIKGRLAHIWASKPIAEIDDHDVHTVVSEARRGKGGSDGKARKLYAALSVFFGWLQDQRRIRNNPCVGSLETRGTCRA